MRSTLHGLLTHGIAPAKGKRGWQGAPTAYGSVKLVKLEDALWRPAGRARRCIWELALHMAYWRYAVRRHLETSVPPFPRSPANWPKLPKNPDQAQWDADRALLRGEEIALRAAVEALPERDFSAKSPQAKQFTRGELIIGIMLHDAHHVGQIQLMKKLMRSQ